MIFWKTAAEDRGEKSNRRSFRRTLFYWIAAAAFVFAVIPTMIRGVFLNQPSQDLVSRPISFLFGLWGGMLAIGYLVAGIARLMTPKEPDYLIFISVLVMFVVGVAYYYGSSLHAP